MRVAHFIQRYPPALGGAEAYFARLSRYLVERGDEVTVFTSNAIALEAFWKRDAKVVPAGSTIEDGVRVRRYPLWHVPGRRYLLKVVSLFPQRLWQCLTMPCNPICPDMWHDGGHREETFDIVHASSFPYAWPIACARRLARRCGAPLIITPFLHTGDPDDPADPTRRGYTTRPLRWLLNEAGAVFVQTPSERCAALEMGLPDAKVILQGLGVDAADCTGGERARARGGWIVAGDEVVLGHLANNSYEKGTVDLLQAVEALWQRDVPAQVVLAGPEMPNFREFWRQFEQRHGAGELRRVRRLGVLDEAQKRDFFAGIDVFVLPSRSDSFGLVLLEAWANGVPNVAYRAGGIADVVRDEVDGLLVPCGKIAALADALGQLVHSADERRRLGEAGRERLPAEFRWDDKLDRVQRTYGALMK